MNDPLRINAGAPSPDGATAGGNRSRTAQGEAVGAIRLVSGDRAACGAPTEVSGGGREKPLIYLRHSYASSGYQQWGCGCDRYTGLGATPEKAYDDWARQVNAERLAA